MSKVKPESDSYHLMRHTIKLLSELHLKPTPVNYTVCYEYAANSNVDVQNALDRLLKDGPGANDASLLVEQIYHDAIEEISLEKLEAAKARVLKVIETVNGSLGEMNADASEFDTLLSGHVAALSNSPTIDTIEQTISALQQETSQLRQSSSRLSRQLEVNSEEVKQLRSDLQRARAEASTDSLTGLKNRKYFIKELEYEISMAKESGAAVANSLLMLDIDHFKNFNDTFGHVVGDKVLAFVANTLCQKLKRADTVGRYGGEEFIVLLRNTSYNSAMEVGEILRATIAKSRLALSNNRTQLPPIHISVGVATQGMEDTVISLIDRADRALYFSKDQGRNCVTGELQLVQR
ncbi:MAG: diguanylate cyclase [Gammaproteobacteria bacterium]|nr:diguanylate cyclase [Gammaproteobacteria bacterium]